MDATMLIVDDSEMNREILSLLFRNDYAILDAENGQEALEVLESCQGHVDIVLLDLVMPDMDGFEVLKLRKTLDYFKDIPVVVITSSITPEDQLRCFELGASDFVSKPFIPEIVLSRVNNVMASHRRMLTIELEAQRLKVKSELDQMTGLYNKTTAEYAIDAILTGNGDQTHALLVVDIDNFKSVNDLSGHLAGDHVIRIVANLLAGLFRKSDVVGRIGGDEFVVLMCNVGSMDIARRKVNELIQIMKYKPNLTIPENVSLSIGLVGNNCRPSSYQELFNKADEALYDAKQAGKARYQEYGVAPLDTRNDTRPAALLISRDRSVCSTVHALIPPELRVVEALSLEDLDRLSENDVNGLKLIYLDVSDKEGDGATCWTQLATHPWAHGPALLALYRESDLAQCRAALAAGVADLLSVPLEGNSFKRRTQRALGVPLPNPKDEVTLDG